MGAVALGGSERLVPRNASGHDRTSGSVATSGEMTQTHNRSGKRAYLARALPVSTIGEALALHEKPAGRTIECSPHYPRPAGHSEGDER